MSLIVIDPGHGGDDPGALGYRNAEARKADPACALIAPTEANLNTMASHLLAGELARSGQAGQLTRMEDVENPSAPGRASMANHKNADLFVSIHHNSAESLTAHGFEALVCRDRGAAFDLAGEICKAVFRRFEAQERGLTVRGVKIRPGLAVLRLTKMPAVLIECGFISNPFEAEFLGFPEIQQELSGLLAETIDEWLRGRPL